MLDANPRLGQRNQADPSASTHLIWARIDTEPSRNDTPDKMSPSELFRNWFQRVWCESDADAIDELLSTPCEVGGIGPEPMRTPQEFKEFHSQLNRLLSNIHVVIDQIIDDGKDQCGGLVTLTACHAVTKKPVKIRCGFTGTVSNGKITQADNVVDFLPLLIALDFVEEDALKHALGG